MEFVGYFTVGFFGVIISFVLPFVIVGHLLRSSLDAIIPAIASGAIGAVLWFATYLWWVHP